MRRTRDQERALHAYERVGDVGEELQKDYGVLVKGLASAVQRNGLSAAVAFIEREKKRPAAKAFLDDLAGGLSGAGIAELKGKDGGSLPGAIRKLPLPAYMLATREVLKLAIWFRRAAQATFGDEEG
jgi:CRISPR-associated protein Cmr5